MPDIRYNFVQTNADDVERAFLRIGAAAQRAERDTEQAYSKITVAARRTAREVTDEGERSARKRQSAEDRAFREAEKAAARYARQFEREEKAKERAAQRAATVQEREAKRAADASAREAKRAAREAERAAKQKEAAERAAAAQQERDTKRAEERKARERQKALDHVARIRDRHLAEEQRKREAEAAAAAQREAKIAQEKQRASEKIRERGRAALGSIRSGIKTGILSGVATGTALTTGIVGAAGKDALQLQETANRISINARQAGQGYLDAGMLRREFEATAQATPGVKASDVADAVQRFITLTGDVGTARRGQRTFATVASATGANIGDVAEAAASISQQFDVKGLEEMREVLAALTYQGKAGAFELRDAAAMFQRLAASGGAFGIEKSVTGVKTLGGLTQIARTGTGSAEQATTAVENVFTNLKTKAEVLKQEGVSVYKDGRVRDVRQIIVEAISKVGGTDIEKKQGGLASIFGEQGIRALNPLISRYNEAFQGAKGTAAERRAVAEAAITQQLQSAIDAPGTWADVVRDSAQAQRDSSAQVTAAFERIKATAGDQLLPALLGLEPAIKPVTDVLIAATPIITSFAEALGGVARYISANFTMSGGDSGRRASEAGARVSELEAISKSRVLTPEEQAQLSGAKREQAAATREQEFISRFVAADTDWSKTKTDKEIDAKAYYDRLQKNPEDAVRYANAVSKFPSVPFMVSGQNEAQVGIVAQEAERVKAERQGAGQPIAQEVEQLKTGLAGLARSLTAATQAASAFNAQQRPSILQGQ